MSRPWQLSKTPLKIDGPAPALGGANREILIDELGYSEEKYKGLWDAGVVGDKPLNPRPMPTMSMDDMVAAGRFAYWDPDYKQKLGIQRGFAPATLRSTRRTALTAAPRRPATTGHIAADSPASPPTFRWVKSSE